MATPRIPNKHARRYVQQRMPFRGSNLYGYRSEQFIGMYIVCSYADHWPLFIYVHGIWFENKDRSSTTTSRHRRQAHPLCGTHSLSHSTMQLLMAKGLEWIAAMRVIEGRELA